MWCQTQGSVGGDPLKPSPLQCQLEARPQEGRAASCEAFLSVSREQTNLPCSSTAEMSSEGNRICHRCLADSSGEQAASTVSRYSSST